MLVSPTIDLILPSIVCIDPDLSPSPLHIGLAIFTQLDSKSQETSRYVCKRWAQWVAKVRLIKRYNHHLMGSREIQQEATHYLGNSNSLKTEQNFLLCMVRLSIDCKNIQAAAANALMILKKTRFEFIGKNLSHIQAPGVRLPRTLLDGVNFTGANLEGADLSDCSLNGVQLDGANLKGIQLGQLPALIHQEELVSMALAPNGKQVASMSTKALYLWDMETLEPQKAHREVEFEVLFNKKGFLLFSADSQWLFTATNDGKVEIWRSHPLKKVLDFTIYKFEKFNFFALALDQRHLISVVELEAFDPPYFRTAIYLWELHLSQESSPQVKLANQIVIEGEPQIKCDLASQASILAIALSGSNLIQLHSLLNLQKIKEISMEGSGHFSHLLFMPNENFLLAAKKTENKSSLHQVEIQVWDLEKNERVACFCEEKEISHWQFIPHTQQLAYITEEGTFCIRNGEKGFQYHVQEKLIHLSLHQNKQFCFANNYLFHMVKKKIVSLSLQNFKVRKETGIKAAIRGLGFSTNEQRFYMVDKQGKLYLYRSTTGQKLFCKPLRTNYPTAAVDEDAIFRFSPDTKHVLQSKSWKAFSLLSIFRENKVLPTSTIGMIRFDYTHLYANLRTKNFNSIALFDLQSQIEKWSKEKNFLACEFSQDGRHIAIACPRELEIWDTFTSHKLASVPLAFTDSSAIDLVISPTLFPQTIVLITESKNEQELLAPVVKAWEIDWNQQVAKQINSFPSAQAGCFINQDRLILQESNQLIFWNYVDSNKECIYTPEGRLRSFDVTKDKSFIVTIEDISEISQSKIKLWDLKANPTKEIDTVSLPLHSSFSLRSIYLSPQGQYVICWSNRSSLEELYAWEIREGRLQFLWKIPKELEGKNISLKNVQRLSLKNAELLAQLQKA